MNLEGLVLRSLPHGERNRIITLLSEQGLIKCFIKLPKKPHLTRLALATVFTKGDYLLRATKSELYQFEDGSCLDQHLGLRSSLKQLQAAQQIVQLLLKTQWQGKPSRALYQLVCAFLKKISETEQPLFIPFLIKFLKHEADMAISGLSEEEQKLFMQIIQARNFDQFPALPTIFEEKIYSKVMAALDASI